MGSPESAISDLRSARIHSRRVAILIAITLSSPARGAAQHRECTDGRERTIDTGRHCCWPGQVYRHAVHRCAGIPTSCPEGRVASGESCELRSVNDGDRGVDEAPAVVCPAGQSVTEDTARHCCWSGQIWSALQSRCIGIPRCPTTLSVSGETCVAAPPDQLVSTPGAVSGAPSTIFIAPPVPEVPPAVRSTHHGFRIGAGFGGNPSGAGAGVVLGIALNFSFPLMRGTAVRWGLFLGFDIGLGIGFPGIELGVGTSQSSWSVTTYAPQVAGVFAYRHRVSSRLALGGRLGVQAEIQFMPVASSPTVSELIVDGVLRGLIGFETTIYVHEKPRFVFGIDTLLGDANFSALGRVGVNF
jgi:hypothetical protein